jgi:DNA-binding response OmpR family regulator
MKVLVVDSSLEILEHYLTVLHASDVEVLTAQTNKQAKRKLRKHADIKAIVWGDPRSRRESQEQAELICSNIDRFPKTMIATASKHEYMRAQALAGCVFIYERGKAAYILRGLASGEPIQKCCME